MLRNTKSILSNSSINTFNLNGKGKTMIIDKLNELKAIVNSGNIPDAKFHWGMHDIGFIDKLPKKQENGFYPDPEYIVTPYSRKISWLMEQLNPAWFGMKDVATDRYEFFIPIIDAVRETLKQDPDASAESLCRAIMTTAEKTIAEAITKAACNGVVNPDGLHIYFAYGSNMNMAQMDERCPGAIKLRNATLPGYKLVERDTADIDVSKNDVVYGVLFAISSAHLKKLDKHEGLLKGIYDRKQIKVQVGDGHAVAVVYEMTPDTKRDRDGKPYRPGYREKCSLGAQQHGVQDGFAL